MALFRPDILITRAGSPQMLLVAEVKASAVDGSMNEPALKSYMVEMSCPVGMMVTPTYIRFYRNRYTGYSPEAVEMIGECPTSDLLGALSEGSVNGSGLERLAEQWLEGLQAGGGERVWPSSVREAIEAAVVSAVSEGIIQAGGPRWRRAS